MTAKKKAAAPPKQAPVDPDGSEAVRRAAVLHGMDRATYVEKHADNLEVLALALIQSGACPLCCECDDDKKRRMIRDAEAGLPPVG